MHHHPLHTPVMVGCGCCRLLTEFTFKDTSDPVVCKGCVRHLGDSKAKTILRDRDHTDLWLSELRLAREAHAAELQAAAVEQDRLTNELVEARAEIADLHAVLEGELDKAPPATVERWWTNERTTAAAEDRDRSYRSRDHAYRVLTMVIGHHRPDESGDRRCVCGESLNRCAVAGALDPVIHAVREWERSQIQRLREGLRHGLPHDHPEVIKHGRRFGPYRRR